MADAAKDKRGDEGIIGKRGVRGIVAHPLDEVVEEEKAEEKEIKEEEKKSSE
jgi:hypothetical protein